MSVTTIGGTAYEDARSLVPSPGYLRRSPSQISQVLIHHSDTEHTGDDVAAIHQIHDYHRRLDWPGIAYSALVMPAGTVYITGDLDTIRYHSGGSHNVTGYAVCLVGRYAQGVPPDTQVAAARCLARDVSREVGRVLLVRGHREVSATVCPGAWWTAWGKGYFNEAEEADMLTDQERRELREHFGLVEGVLRKADEAQRLFPLAPGKTYGEQGRERLDAVKRILVRLGL